MQRALLRRLGYRIGCLLCNPLFSSDSLTLYRRSLVSAVDGRLHGACALDLKDLEGHTVFSSLSNDPSGLAANFSASLQQDGSAVVVNLEGDCLGVLVRKVGVNLLRQRDNKVDAVRLAVLEGQTEGLKLAVLHGFRPFNLQYVAGSLVLYYGGCL